MKDDSPVNALVRHDREHLDEKLESYTRITALIAILRSFWRQHISRLIVHAAERIVSRVFFLLSWLDETTNILSITYTGSLLLQGIYICRKSFHTNHDCLLSVQSHSNSF